MIRWPLHFSGRKELDLRKELNRTFFGANDEIAKGAFNILRRMRSKQGILYPVYSTDLEECPCKTDSLQQEPDKDYPCNICQGEGYLFDDEIVISYKTNRFEYQDVEKYKPWGKQTSSMSFFYVEYHEWISRFDKILEVVHHPDGQIKTPIQIQHRHNIHMAEEFRLDNGRTEHWRLSCFTD